MKKKVLALVLVLVLVAALTVGLVACGGETTDDNSAQQGPKIVKNEKYKDMKIGVLHIGDPADGAGYSYAHDQGIVGMQVALGITNDQVVRKLNIDDGKPADIKAAAEDCVKQGCNIIFGTSYGYMDTLVELSTKYPDVIFSHGTGFKSNETNMNNYFGRIYQARYLSGIAAGLKAKALNSKNVGYVAAFGEDVPETCSGINAFALGVQAVDPSITVKVKVLKNWFDPANETAAAEALASNCSVIAQHCDTTNPQLVAQDKGIFGCGYNSDMTAAAPAAHLCAPIWNWEVYYTLAVEAALGGKENFMATVGQAWYGGLADGFVDISTPSLNCAEGTKSAINQVKAMMVNWENAYKTQGAGLTETTTDNMFAVFSGYKLKITVENGSAKIVKEKAALGRLQTANAEKEITELVINAGDKYCGDGCIKGAMNTYVSNVDPV